MKRKLIISMLATVVLLFSVSSGNVNVYAGDGGESDSTEIVVNTEIDITDETDVDKEAGETNTPIIKENEDIPDIVEGLTEKKEDEDAINEVTTGQAIEYIDRIYDIATGEGIESVDVTAENKTTGDLYNCLSDNEGYFKLSLVAGDYKLILKRAGYKEKMVDINVK